MVLLQGDSFKALVLEHLASTSSYVTSMLSNCPPSTSSLSHLIGEQTHSKGPTTCSRPLDEEVVART